MFQAILYRKHAALHRHAASFLLIHKDKASSGLCLDHSFSYCIDLISSATSLQDLSPALRSFEEYTLCLGHVASSATAWDEQWVQYLFGFKPSMEGNTIIVYPSALVYTATKRFALPLDSTRDEIVVPLRDFIPALQEVARERLRTRVQEENTVCSQSLIIFPCTAYTIYGECPRSACSPSHMRTQQVFSASAFNLRLRCILQQVLIYKTAESLMERKEQMQQRR